MTQEEYEVFKVTATLESRGFIFDNPWTQRREIWRHGELDFTRPMSHCCLDSMNALWGKYNKPTLLT
jgi:hypothetical protein